MTPASERAAPEFYRGAVGRWTNQLDAAMKDLRAGKAVMLDMSGEPQATANSARGPILRKFRKLGGKRLFGFALAIREDKTGKVWMVPHALKKEGRS